MRRYATRSRGRPRPFTVLQSIQRPRPTTNPYLTQLFEHLRPGVDVQYFSWRRALIGHIDVLHIHWPEHMLLGRSRASAAAKRILFAVVLVRLHIQRKAIVRTLHNIKPHETPRWIDRKLLNLCDHWTTWWIRLNPTTPLPSRAPASTILIGHYRDLYDQSTVPTRQPGHILYFGHIRQYKGIDTLLAAFRGTSDPALRLRLIGNAQDQSIADSIRMAQIDDSRISASLEFVDDDELTRAIGAATLVALPYRGMHNSSAALLALSLNRPILVPNEPVIQELATEVGDRWVITYSPPLTSEDLETAMDAAGRVPETSAPDLSAREWPAIAQQHIQTYRDAHASIKRRLSSGGGNTRRRDLVRRG